MEGCRANHTATECDTIYEGVIESAIALNLAIKQDFEDTGGGALVCEKPGGSIDHDHVCPTGNEHDPTLDDGHTITIRVADVATDTEFEENWGTSATRKQCICITTNYRGRFHRP